jgi:glycosyltransferase involved in cell wall biosynthesis
MSGLAGAGKVHVLLVANGLGYGGAEVVIQRLVENIDRSRFDVTVCCIRRRGPIGEQLARDGTDVIELSQSASAFSALLAFLSLRRVIRQRGVDIVHTHTTVALFVAALCKLMRTKFRLVHTFHFGNYPHRPRKQMLLERFGSGVADLLVAVGDEQRKQLIGAFGFRGDRVVRVWNGVAFAPPAGSGTLRRQIGADNRLIVGTIATLIEQKGLFDLLQVARRLRDRGARLHFVVLGDGVLRPRLESARSELGLDEIVTFAGWIPDAAQVGLPAFDVFFQPSLWEAMSIALLEAMAAGKAIVATRVGEAPHMVRDGIDGLLVEPRDIEGMCGAIMRIVEDPGLRRRLGSSAAAAAACRFTVEAMARAHEAIYAQLR